MAERLQAVGAAIDERIRITAASYDATVEQYVARHGVDMAGYDSSRFLSLLPAQARILDLGCGPGRDSRFFLDHGYQVVGLDISSAMLEEARKAAPEATFQQMDLCALRLDAASFDGVWASASLHHVPKKDIVRTLASIKHSLKPGGLLWCTLKEGTSEGLEPDARYGGVQKFWSYSTSAELRGNLDAVGFEVLFCERDPATVSYPITWVRALARSPLPSPPTKS